jgi:hypothetical protein
MHLALDLADKYPRDSLAAHILDVVAQFLPALHAVIEAEQDRQYLTPNASSVVKGKEGLWETAPAFCTARN